MARNPEQPQMHQPDISAGSYFPWLLQTTDERNRSISQDAKPRINTNYANALDEAAYARVYGEILSFEDLSDEARVCLTYLSHIYRDLIEQPLIESRGNNLTIDPDTQTTLSHFIQSLEQRIPNNRERTYVTSQIDAMQARYEQLAYLLLQAQLMGVTLPDHLPGLGSSPQWQPDIDNS